MTEPDVAADPPPPAIELRELSVGYRSRHGERVVLERVTCAIEHSELVCLVGLNGAGKSTLLRTIAGLQPSLAGEVRFNGVPIESLHRYEIARHLSTVLTDRVDPGRLSVRDVVALGRHPHTEWTGRLDERDQLAVDRALAQTAAADLAQRDFSELSDGQRQRVLVARALAQEPRLLLLDEPTAFLDPPARIALLALLARIAREDRVAVLVTTHDIELAARVADSIWVAHPSGNVDCGAPEDLIHSGALSAPFTTNEIAFDAQTLSFVPVETGRPTASLVGGGPSAVLAAHALRRAGFKVANSSDGTRVEVVNTATSPQEPIHTVLFDGRTLSEHRGVASLVRALRALKAPRLDSSTTYRPTPLVDQLGPEVLEEKP